MNSLSLTCSNLCERRLVLSHGNSVIACHVCLVSCFIITTFPPRRVQFHSTDNPGYTK